MSRSEPTGPSRPALDVGPVPRRPTSDRPARIGEQVAVTPDIDGLSPDAESFGDLGDAYGVARFHAGNCSERLDKCLPCSDNNYMNNTDLHTFTTNTYGVDFDDLSTDAGNVIRRAFEAGEAPELDLFSDITGMVQIRWAA